MLVLHCNLFLMCSYSDCFHKFSCDMRNINAHGLNQVVPKRCVARDHEVCREIKKNIFKLILIMIKN
jgi:hypothetical protein